ncbi:hypothetical protein FACS1894172_03020 [Spirochaetia bacterium]|nr:hypothetical protein FACS1894172_03020 [Spirochaetia bacterium]
MDEKKESIFVRGAKALKGIIMNKVDEKSRKLPPWKGRNENLADKSKDLSNIASNEKENENG